MGMTPQHFHTIPTSCAIQVANYAHHKTLHARSLFIRTKWTRYSCSIVHSSLPSIHNSMFSSNKTSQHNLNSNIPYRPYAIHTIHTIQTQHCSWTPQFLHTGRTDHICHTQYSNYIVHCSHSQHNPLLMHINMHSQHYPPHCLPHCLPQPSAHN